jgi:SAM-dependent methyltransferase
VSHWRKAHRHWRHVGSPLRPDAEECGLFSRALRDVEGGATALVLGSTSELANLSWPEETRVLAVDSSHEMLSHRWPGLGCRAQWTALPLPDRSLEVVLCDGGVGLLPYPEGQRELAAELGRVIRPGGTFVVRLFHPAGPRESVEAVLAAAPTLPDLNAFKFRLWMALLRSPEEGVRPRDVYALIHEQAGGDLRRLAREYGWPEEHVLALNLHRGSEARYCWSNPEQVGALFADWFEGGTVWNAAHPFGDQCSILALTRAADR